METLLTSAQVADQLGVSTRYVSELARRGELPGRQEGRWWYYDPADVERYRAQRAGRNGGSKPRILQDGEALAALYDECGTVTAMAQELGCGVWSVHEAMRRHGITVERWPRPQKRRSAPPDPRRYYAVAAVFGHHGQRPPPAGELCPPGCAALDDDRDCLDVGRCLLDNEGAIRADGAPGKEN